MAFVALINDEEVHGELDDLENIILEKGWLKNLIGDAVNNDELIVSLAYKFVNLPYVDEEDSPALVLTIDVDEPDLKLVEAQSEWFCDDINAYVQDNAKGGWKDQLESIEDDDDISYVLVLNGKLYF